jgi:hypothetical protein
MTQRSLNKAQDFLLFIGPSKLERNEHEVADGATRLRAGATDKVLTP